jgi:hypothetical protein
LAREAQVFVELWLPFSVGRPLATAGGVSFLSSIAFGTFSLASPILAVGTTDLLAAGLLTLAVWCLVAVVVLLYRSLRFPAPSRRVMMRVAQHFSGQLSGKPSASMSRGDACVAGRTARRPFVFNVEAGKQSYLVSLTMRLSIRRDYTSQFGRIMIGDQRSWPTIGHGLPGPAVCFERKSMRIYVEKGAYAARQLAPGFADVIERRFAGWPMIVNLSAEEICWQVEIDRDWRKRGLPDLNSTRASVQLIESLDQIAARFERIPSLEQRLPSLPPLSAASFAEFNP